MANVLNRQTLQYLRSVNTPDYPPADWVINPDMSAVEGLDVKYWKLSGDSVQAMTQAERDAVDAAEQAALVADEKAAAIALLTGVTNRPVFLAMEAAFTVTRDDIHSIKDELKGQGVSKPKRTMQELIAEAVEVINNG